MTRDFTEYEAEAAKRVDTYLAKCLEAEARIVFAPGDDVFYDDHDCPREATVVSVERFEGDGPISGHLRGYTITIDDQGYSPFPSTITVSAFDVTER